MNLMRAPRQSENARVARQQRRVQQGRALCKTLVHWATFSVYCPLGTSFPYLHRGFCSSRRNQSCEKTSACGHSTAGWQQSSSPDNRENSDNRLGSRQRARPNGWAQTLAAAKRWSTRPLRAIRRSNSCCKKWKRCVDSSWREQLKGRRHLLPLLSHTPALLRCRCRVI